MKTKTAAAALAMMALVGCTLTQSDTRPDALWPQIGTAGRTLMPNRCALKMVIASSPLQDDLLGETLWSVADAQVIDDQARRDLADNGLRIGLVTGSLPPEVQALIDDEQNQANATTIVLPDGESTLVSTGAETARPGAPAEARGFD